MKLKWNHKIKRNRSRIFMSKSSRNVRRIIVLPWNKAEAGAISAHYRTQVFRNLLELGRRRFCHVTPHPKNTNLTLLVLLDLDRCFPERSQKYKHCHCGRYELSMMDCSNTSSITIHWSMSREKTARNDGGRGRLCSSKLAQTWSKNTWPCGGGRGLVADVTGAELLLL